ncbi:MAG: ABC transporter ATP-binding protein [Candidatus Omnitrophica bacterium]|nr:ABC transporter ATP-binding protein [Candidatus Omnitrophota bacterium]
MLTLENVKAGYGNIEVLHGISLRVREGEIATVIGANGAGKTTLLSAISGLIPLRSGEIRFKGKSLTGVRADEIVRRGLCHIPEGRRIFSKLTVRENFELGAYRARDKKKVAKTFESLLDFFPILRERLAQPSGLLSGGEQQMLAIARGLMSIPEMILLDEPSLGLAPKVVSDIFKHLVAINQSGTTLLLVEQNAMLALETAQDAYVLETGSVLMKGKSSELLNSDLVRKAYLGE